MASSSGDIESGDGAAELVWCGDRHWGEQGAWRQDIRQSTSGLKAWSHACGAPAIRPETELRGTVVESAGMAMTHWDWPLRSAGPRVRSAPPPARRRRGCRTTCVALSAQRTGVAKVARPSDGRRACGVVRVRYLNLSLCEHDQYINNIVINILAGQRRCGAWGRDMGHDPRRTNRTRHTHTVFPFAFPPHTIAREGEMQCQFMRAPRCPRAMHSDLYNSDGAFNTMVSTACTGPCISSQMALKTICWRASERLPSNSSATQ